MADKIICNKSDLTAVADAIRTKIGVTDSYIVSELGSTISNELTKKLPTLTNPGTASDLLSGKELIDQDGNVVTGTIPTKTSSDLTSSGATVTVPAGYYVSSTSKSVSTATQAIPSISVNSSGLITASATQSAGYVSSGTKSATKQLTTKAAATITPGTSDQTIASGTYLTGSQTIKGDTNLVAGNIKSGTSIFGVIGTYEGSGGGGSSGGESNIKFEFGTFTPASDAKKITISHTLGKIPEVVFVRANTSPGGSYNRFAFSIKKFDDSGFDYSAADSKGYDISLSGYGSKWQADVSNRYGTATTNIFDSITDSNFTLSCYKASSSQIGCKAGVTYYWVAIAAVD